MTEAIPAIAHESAEQVVTELYQLHRLGLIGTALVLTGDRPTAEDVVQEAFAGLYRRWEKLSDPGKALPYVRASVLNDCRSQLRRHGRAPAVTAAAGLADAAPPVVSAESAVLSAEQSRSVLRALRQLPPRQREVLVLRFYLDLSEREIAAAMGIGPSTVRSTAHRALGALGRMLEEPS